ncbi:MAG: ANTAR domain-containing protein [Anaerolineaceae bacterium]|nr:ANTAR domain-containing protein [Anaerolineaceae bacterium]
MGLKEQVYSVLVISSSENFNSALESLLPVSHFQPVRYAGSINAGKRLANQRNFDLVIINSPLPDDIGSGFAIDISAVNGTVVLFILRSDILENLRSKFIDAGVFTLSKPLSSQMFSQALEWLMSARERLRKAETKTISIEEKMAEIRMVNRAKWLLITELKMEEPQAHRFIEKQAMDRCISKREIAEEIIRTYS